MGDRSSMASLEDPHALVGQIEQVRGRSLPSLFSWDERTLAHSSPTIVIPWTLDFVSASHAGFCVTSVASMSGLLRRLGTRDEPCGA